MNLMQMQKGDIVIFRDVVHGNDVMRKGTVTGFFRQGVYIRYVVDGQIERTSRYFDEVKRN